MNLHPHEDALSPSAAVADAGAPAMCQAPAAALPGPLHWLIGPQYQRLQLARRLQVLRHVPARSAA